MGFFAGIGALAAQVIFGLLLFVAVLRVLLPIAGVRFRNPVCQIVYRITNPVLAPLSRLVPNWRNVSLAGILVAWLLAVIEISVILALGGLHLPPLTLAVVGIGSVAQFTLGVYFWSIVIRALMSFFSPDYGNPAVEVLYALTEPVLRPFRRLPPRLDGFDLSPLWACLAIQLAQYVLRYLGMPAFPF